MKLTYPVSIPMLPRLDVADTHIAFADSLDSSDYVSALAVKRAHGERVYSVGHRDNMPLKVDGSVNMDLRALGHTGAEFGYTIWDFEAYKRAVADPEVTFLPIGMGLESHHRVMLLKKIVDAGVFCHTKPHWLYGVVNPAELGVYRVLFSQHTLKNIVLAVCSSCFLYSIYGVVFSSTVGIFEPLRMDLHREDLGMAGYMTYSMSKDQQRLFHRNRDTVHSFLEGEAPREYTDWMLAQVAGEETD